MAFDIYIETVPADRYDGFTFVDFGRTLKGGTFGVDGIQKLIQVYLLALLTPLGTDPLDLGRGTQLPNLIGANVTTKDAHEILLLSVEKATSDVLAAQLGQDIPSSERLLSATVTDFIAVTSAPGIAAQIFVENQAQEGLTFLLPVLKVKTA